MKTKFFAILAAAVLLPSLAFAGYDLSTKNFSDTTATAGAAMDGDYRIPVYDLDARDAGLLQADDLYGWRDSFTICGEATTVNNNTVYYGPDRSLAFTSASEWFVADGTKCDLDATGNTTEATADAPVYTNQAVDVLGMTCRNEGDANADISFTLRTAAGATAPSVTCTIADGERDCVADIQSTTQIAAGATVAVAAASTSNVGDGNGFICRVAVGN